MYRESIRSLYAQFAPGYRRIADYLLEHYQDAAFMTAAEIGRHARVDTALVVRFAQRLGYSGYPELINEVQEDVKRDLRAVYEPPGGDDSVGHTVRSNLLHDRNSLDYMLLHFDAATVERVVTALINASRIFAIGEGNAAFLAEAFVARLVMMGYPAHVVSSGIMGQAAVTSTIRSDDVVLGMTMTVLSPSVTVALRVAREAGAYTVGVVGSLSNPAAAAADTVLFVPTKTEGVMPSWSAMASMLHGLSQVLAGHRRMPEADWALGMDRYRQHAVAALKQPLKSADDAMDAENSQLDS